MYTELSQNPQIVVPVYRQFFKHWMDGTPENYTPFETVKFSRKFCKNKYGGYWVFECQSCIGSFKHSVGVPWIKEGKIDALYHKCTHPDYKLEPGQPWLRHCWGCMKLLSEPDGRPIKGRYSYQIGATTLYFCSYQCGAQHLDKEAMNAKSSA